MSHSGEHGACVASIEVGDTVNGLVEVRKGLQVGETVVASSTLFIDRAAARD